PRQGGTGGEVGAAAAANDVVHDALAPAGAKALDLVLGGVRVAGHAHLHLVLAQELVKGGEVGVAGALVVPARVERMSEDDHRELAARSLEPRAEPGELVDVDAPEHAR